MQTPRKLAPLLMVGGAMLVWTMPGAAAQHRLATPRVGSTDTLAPLGATPGTGGATSAVWDTNHQHVTFTYADSSTTLAYTVAVSDTWLAQGLLRVAAQLNGQSAGYPLAYAGLTYRDTKGKQLQPGAFTAVAKVTRLGTAFDGQHLVLSYQDKYQGVTNQYSYDLSMSGKTLLVHVTSGANTANLGNYDGFSFDRSENTSGAKIVSISYVEHVPLVSLPAQKLFYSTYIDPTSSHAGTFLSQTRVASASSVYCGYYSVYAGDSAGQHEAINDLAYLTVSQGVMDVLPQVNNPASPYRADMADRVYMDFWGEKSFAKSEADISVLYNTYGMRRLSVAYQDWQRYGYDNKMPAVYPANPNYGGTAFRHLVATVEGFGYLFAPHETYWVTDPTGPLWKPADVAKDANLQYRQGWTNPWTKVVLYPIASDKMMQYAQPQDSQIASDYHPNADYLDVNFDWTENTLRQLDYNAANTSPRTSQQFLQNVKALAVNAHTQFGPLMSEGGDGPEGIQFMYAGYADGMVGNVLNGSKAPVIPDYEQRAIHPLMMNKGMGYPNRFFPPKTKLNLDEYRATTLAYGHTGFISYLNYTIKEDVREYYLFQQLQAQYGQAAAVPTITYQDGGAMVQLGSALRDGVDFTNPQIMLSYPGGLTIYVNRNQAQNWNVTLNGIKYTLPPNGWVAANSAGFLEYSALVNGNHADYVQSPTYLFADGRGTMTDFGAARTAATLAISGWVAGSLVRGQPVIAQGTGTVALGQHVDSNGVAMGWGVPAQLVTANNAPVTVSVTAYAAAQVTMSTQGAASATLTAHQLQPNATYSVAINGATQQTQADASGTLSVSLTLPATATISITMTGKPK